MDVGTRAVWRPIWAATLLAAGLAVTTSCSLAGEHGEPTDTATLPAPSGPYSTSVEPCEPAAGNPSAGALPELRLPCLGEGPPVDLAALAGRPTVVNLWASWCGPCREEMPGMQQVHQEHGEDVRFLGVNTQDRPEAAAAFVEDLKVTYPQVIDQNGRLLRHVGAPGLPVTLVLDAQGRLSSEHIGVITPDQLRSAIDRAR